MFWIGSVLLASALGTGVAALWFFLRFVRQEHLKLADNVHAILHGGGNSLIIEESGQVLLVDTKFWPASESLRKWIAREIGLPVSIIVNTHYHYDHTYGNPLYPGAAIYAYKNVSSLMMRCGRANQEYWRKHPAGMPNRPVGDAPTELTVGTTKILLIHTGIAHTHGDLVVVLPQHRIVATGDLFFNGFYPFIDTDPRCGASIPGMVRSLRKLANQYSDGTFIPGHGPIATAADVREYADYLDDLYVAVKAAYDAGLSEDKAVGRIDVSRWKRRTLPPFPEGILPQWTTAKRNIRAVYRLLQEGPPLP